MRAVAKATYDGQPLPVTKMTESATDDLNPQPRPFARVSISIKEFILWNSLSVQG